MIDTIDTTDALARFCAEARAAPYVTIDTEFIRERSYYAKLCLLQMAIPGSDGASGGAAVLVDPLAEGLSLDPVYELLRHTGTVKVLHAARQDLEIFLTEGGTLPQPLFDTQVAAMVCGFGDQVAYETLVRKVARASLDKTSRFTDWARRPLSEAQKAYALADVTHLRVIYEWLAAQLARSGRLHWVEEELALLSDPENYVTRPEDAWKKVRTRSASPRFLAIVRELARFREIHARTANIPRGRVFKDDALLEVASTRPTDATALGRSRLLQREARRGPIAEGILQAVRAGMEADTAGLEGAADNGRNGMQVDSALADLLRVLLKAKSESEGVAQKLLASSGDLDALAAGRRDVPALQGWRAEVFGNDALRLCQGEVALAAAGGSVRLVPVG